MEYQEIPTSYKNYLPSKKMQRIVGIILLLVIVGVVIFLLVSNKGNFSLFARKTVQPPEPLIVTAAPQVRSTLNDGIPDWQKILVGLDPADPNSTAAFQERKMALEREGVWENVNTVSTDDQLGIEIGNQLLEAGNLNDQSITQETADAVLAYIDQLELGLKQYTRTDIDENPVSNRESDLSYLTQLETISKNLLSIETGSAAIQNYFEGSTPKTAIATQLTGLSKFIEQLLETPVPSGLQSLHLQVLNTTYGMHQILDTYELIDASDDIKKFAAITLFQDKVNQLGQLWFSINTYFLLGSDE